MPSKKQPENGDSNFIVYTVSFLREHEERLDMATGKIEKIKSELKNNTEKMNTDLKKIIDKINLIENEIAKIRKT